MGSFTVIHLIAAAREMSLVEQIDPRIVIGFLAAWIIIFAALIFAVLRTARSTARTARACEALLRLHQQRSGGTRDAADALAAMSRGRER
jgi:hypothetical protein